MSRGLGILVVVTVVITGVSARAQQDPLRAHYERAQSFQLGGELEQAEAEYRREVLPRALRRLGNLSGAEGRSDESVELLEEAARLLPADVEIRTDLAVAWLRKGNIERAGTLAKAAVSAAPTNARARSLLGRTKLLADDAEGAATELRKSLDQEARFETAFALALASLQLRRPETARALFDQMTVANTSPELLVLIGRAYLESNDPKEAGERFRLALARDEHTRDAHYFRGLALLADTAPNRIALARAEFEAELRNEPGHARARAVLDGLAQGREQSVAAERGHVLLDLLPSATSADDQGRRELRAQLESVLQNSWHNLGVIHTSRGETEAADNARRRAERWAAADSRTTPVATDIDAVIRSAEEQLQAGNLDASERTIASVLESQPQRASGLRVLGLIRAAQGRYDEAEALLRRAISADRTEAGALLTLARAYVTRGEFQRALSALNQAPSEQEDAGSSIKARALLGLDRVADARALLTDVAGRAGADDAAAVAEALVARNLVDDAATLLERVRGRNVSSARLFIASARVCLRRDDTAGAEAWLERGLALDAGSIDSLQLLAEIASHRGDDARAADLLTRAIQRVPDSPQVLRELAEASARAARLEEALAAARRLNALRPDDIDARRLLAVTLLQNQNWREAIEILESAPSAAATDPRWPLALGMAHFGRRDYAAARTAFERALVLDPALAEAHYHLGLIAREQGRTADAIEAFSAVLAHDPSHPSAHVELGTLYLASVDLGRARRHLDCAIAVNPDDPTPHYQLGLLFRRSGDEERARGEMQRFEEKRKNMLATPRAGVVKPRSRKGRC